MGPRPKVDFVESHASAAPCPRRAAEGTTHCNLHRRMTLGVDDCRARGLGQFRVDSVSSGFEHDDVAAESLEFESQCHADGPGADDAEIARMLPGGEVLKDHDRRSICEDTDTLGVAGTKCILLLRFHTVPGYAFQDGFAEKVHQTLHVEAPVHLANPTPSTLPQFLSQQRVSNQSRNLSR